MIFNSGYYPSTTASPFSALVTITYYGTVVLTS